MKTVMKKIGLIAFWFFNIACLLIPWSRFMLFGCFYILGIGIVSEHIVRAVIITLLYIVSVVLIEKKPKVFYVTGLVSLVSHLAIVLHRWEFSLTIMPGPYIEIVLVIGNIVAFVLAYASKINKKSIVKIVSITGSVVVALVIAISVIFIGKAIKESKRKDNVNIIQPGIIEIWSEEELTEAPTEEPTEVPTEVPTEPGMSEKEKNAFMEKSAKAVISHVGKILVDNPMYVVAELKTIDGHYVEILFVAEPEVYAKNSYIEQKPGKKSAFMATAWVSDELEVTECYLEAYASYTRERAALGLEGKPYDDGAKEREHFAAKEIIGNKLEEYKSNNRYTLKTFSDEELWKVYDECMTERLCSKETVKRDEVVKKQVYETLTYSFTEIFNEKGILIEKEEVDKYGTKKYIYNDEGCLINKNGTIYEVVKEYDTNGNFVRDIGYNNSVVYWICEYDINGNLTRVFKKGEEEIFYEYDENGYLIKKVRYDYTNNEKTFYSWIEYENDENGRMIKWTRCNSNGIHNLSKYYTYDAAGNVIRIVDNYHSSGDEATIFYIYDSEGRLIREYEYNGKIGNIEIREYTIWGDKVEDDYTIEYDYTYYDTGEVETARVYSVTEDGNRTYNLFRRYDKYGRLIAGSFSTYDMKSHFLKYEYF